MSNAFTNPGTNVTQRIVFNSGFVDFGSNRIVDVDNVTMSIEWGIATLYVLNSIKPADIARHTQKVTFSGKIKSFPAELYNVALGSSTIGVPVELDTFDGQPTLQSPVISLIDRNGKQIQYQLSGAIFKSAKLAAKMEDFAEWDFEIEAKDLAALVYTT